VIETFLGRRHDLSNAMRERTAQQLAQRIRNRLEIPAGSHVHDEALIEAIAAEYRARR
jgi:hypothetical protein